jgi:hypothetical protein
MNAGNTSPDFGETGENAESLADFLGDSSILDIDIAAEHAAEEVVRANGVCCIGGVNKGLN